MASQLLSNHIGGQWTASAASSEPIAVTDPATGEILAFAPRSTDDEVDAAVAAAVASFAAWRRTPVPTRAAMLFRYRQLLTEAIPELTELITAENGKTLDDAAGELVRAIQYVEHAAAAPELMKGAVTEEIATGVDIEYIREPLGPFAIIAPFNFPAMIPLYFSWAVACGNPVVIKPSEACPLTTIRLVELATQAGIPGGVVNMVLGDASVVRGLCTHPDIAGVSFVGSSEVAAIVYRLASDEGKRCQAQGGAKNHMVVTDTAQLGKVMPNIVSSMFGNSSQRCFAGSNLLVYRRVYDEFLERFTDAVNALVLGPGRDGVSTLGPVISAAARTRFIDAVDAAEAAGATVLIDGRKADVPQYPGGNWLGATLVGADPDSAIWREELFGPVRCISAVDDLDAAIAIINESRYGHTAAIYTELGGVAREFRQRVDTGQIGINVGTPAPIAFYAVGGRKASFYGSLRGRANDAVDFYTDKKVVVSTWHLDTSSPAPVDPAFTGSV